MLLLFGNMTRSCCSMPGSHSTLWSTNSIWRMLQNRTFIVACVNAGGTSSSPPTYIWNATANSNKLGGQSTADTTLTACQSSCTSNVTCTGIDFDNNTNPSPTYRCYLAGPWSTSTLRIGSAPGVTHYDLTVVPGSGGTSAGSCGAYACSARNFGSLHYEIKIISFKL